MVLRLNFSKHVRFEDKSLTSGRMCTIVHTSRQHQVIVGFDLKSEINFRLLQSIAISKFKSKTVLTPSPFLVNQSKLDLTVQCLFCLSNLIGQLVRSCEVKWSYSTGQIVVTCDITHDQLNIHVQVYRLSLNACIIMLNNRLFNYYQIIYTSDILSKQCIL